MAPLIELQTKTPAGAALVRCAESLAQRLAATAAEHDTSGTYPLENVTVLKDAGYFVAPIPRQFGSQGVDSLFDILVASTRLARGDASTTLGLNMHLLVVLNMVRRWRITSERGDERRTRAFGRSFERIVNDGVVIAAAASEPNQNLTQPASRATRNGTGWFLNGRKIFATMSPAATMMLVWATYEDAAGNLLYGYAEVPAETPGVAIPRRLGRARYARVGQQLGEFSRRAPARVGGTRWVPVRRRGGLHGGEPGQRPVPRVGVSRHRRERTSRCDRTHSTQWR
jgi:L-evernosamine nitrososynthase